MITKAEIQSIDYTGNTCIVRMPFFEAASGGEKALAKAIISTTPGIYNGYKEGDIVIVAFEDGQAQAPCVIGKLFLGTNTENQTPRSVVNCDSLKTNSNNSLPLSTKIESDTPQNNIEIAGTSTTYKTLKEAFGAIKANENKIETLISKDINSISPGTTMCMGPVTNIYGYTDTGYNYKYVEVEGGYNYYYITYRNQLKLTPEQAKHYMLYMAGKEVLPTSCETDQYNGVFMNMSLQVYYPLWDPENNNLILLIIKQKSFEERVRDIIEEYLGDGTTVVDLTTGTKDVYRDGAKSIHLSNGEVEYEGKYIADPVDLSSEDNKE